MCHAKGLYAGEVGVPRLLKLFKKYAMKTTWFIPGMRGIVAIYFCISFSARASVSWQDTVWRRSRRKWLQCAMPVTKCSLSLRFSYVHENNVHLLVGFMVILTRCAAQGRVLCLHCLTLVRCTESDISHSGTTERYP